MISRRDRPEVPWIIGSCVQLDDRFDMRPHQNISWPPFTQVISRFRVCATYGYLQYDSFTQQNSMYRGEQSDWCCFALEPQGA